MSLLGLWGLQHPIFSQDLTAPALSPRLEAASTKHGRAPLTHIQPKALIFSAPRQALSSSSGWPFCSASSGLASCLPTHSSWLHPRSHVSGGCSDFPRTLSFVYAQRSPGQQGGGEPEPLVCCTQERRGRAKRAEDTPHRGNTSCHPLTEQMRELTKKYNSLCETWLC